MPFAWRQVFGRRYAACWTLAAGLAATAALAWELDRVAVEMDRQRLAMRAAEIQAQLDARMEKSEMLLHNLRDYLRWSREMRESVFQRWCYENGLTINCPWILGIAVATNRNKASWRELLPKNPETWTTNEWAKLAGLAYQRPISCDLVFRSEVRDGKQFLTNYQLSPTFYGAFQRYSSWNGTNDWLALSIRQGSRAGMSSRREVMLDAQGHAITGTLFHVPIHSPEFDELMAIRNVPNPKYNISVGRWLDLESVIIAPVDFNVLAQSLWEDAPADMGIEIFSSTNQSADTWMNMSGSILPHAADPEFGAYLVHRQMWRMYGMKFSLFFYTTTLFEAQSPRRLAKVTGAAGIVLTLLAAALVAVAQRAQTRQEQMIEQIREARDALAAAQQERSNISRDLHDGTVQSLYAIQLALGHADREFAAAPAKGSRALQALRRDLDGVIAEIRQFISAEIATGEALDFGTVLESLAERARSGTTTAIKLQCEPAAARRLAGDQAVQFANIVREAMSNSLRHGRAKELRIALCSSASDIVLKVVDDGVGFDPANPPRTGVGLSSMASRAKETGANFDLRSSPGKGTEIEVRLPVRSGLDEDWKGSPSNA